jgi:hypothetical protein
MLTTQARTVDSHTPTSPIGRGDALGTAGQYRVHLRVTNAHACHESARTHVPSIAPRARRASIYPHTWPAQCNHRRTHAHTRTCPRDSSPLPCRASSSHSPLHAHSEITPLHARMRTCTCRRWLRCTCQYHAAFHHCAHTHQRRLTPQHTHWNCPT